MTQCPTCAGLGHYAPDRTAYERNELGNFAECEDCSGRGWVGRPAARLPLEDFPGLHPTHMDRWNCHEVVGGNDTRGLRAWWGMKP